jgi:hypothetical protein
VFWGAGECSRSLSGCFRHMNGSWHPVFIRQQRVLRNSLRVTDMTTSHDPFRVLEVDRCHNGIVIRFADGTMFFYGSEFLYKHRAADGNREVADDPGAL